MHAMLFVANVKAYKVSVKFIKLVNQHVYSIGFPVSSFDLQTRNGQLSIKQQLQNIGGEIREHEHKIEFTNIEWKDKPDYKQWCLQQNNKQINNDNESNIDFETLKQRILSFQVVNKTPMQAFEFIMELQGELKN